MQQYDYSDMRTLSDYNNLILQGNKVKTNFIICY